MASEINGFEPLPLYPYADWRYAAGWHLPSVVQPDARGEAPAEPEGQLPEKTGRQGALTGIGRPGLWGDTPRGTPAEYRRMRRIPAIALVRSKVANAILSGSWSVEADDNAPPKAKELIERRILPHRTVLLKHAVRGLDFGYGPFEQIWTVDQGLSFPAYFKALRQDLGTRIWITPQGHFVGLSTASDGQVRREGEREPSPGTGPTITGPECLLWSYDAEPGEWYGRSRLENCRELAAKWIEVQNKIGALLNKESGSVTKVTVPPDDISADAKNTGAEFAKNIASGSAYLVVDSVLKALTPQQRRSATVDQIIKLLAEDLWGVENINVGGNAPAILACQGYSQYLDVCLIRAYLQPERGVIEGEHGTKAEAADHGDTGTLDCESVERDFVDEAINPQVVDAILVENWGPNARGTVRVKANPLRDVQEAIDTMLISNVSTNTATADEFYRTYDFDAVAQRRGIPKRKTPLPKAEPVAPPVKPAGFNGSGDKPPVDENDRRLARLAASRWLDGE